MKEARPKGPHSVSSHVCEVSRHGKSIRIESSCVVATNRGEKGMGNNRLMSSVSGDAKVLELGSSGDGCITVQMYLMPLNEKPESG